MASCPPGMTTRRKMCPSALSAVPYANMSNFSSLLAAMNAGDQTNTRDDAGLPMVYGSCKLLDLLLS